jgi:hypothetical protein
MPRAATTCRWPSNKIGAFGHLLKRTSGHATALRGNTAFANAPMKCGRHMAACTAKPSSTGLRPNGNYWRHRRQSSPANQIRRSAHGCPHVRRPPERSPGLADAADLTRDARPCSAAISTTGRLRSRTRQAIGLMRNPTSRIARVAIGKTYTEPP